MIIPKLEFAASALWMMDVTGNRYTGVVIHDVPHLSPLSEYVTLRKSHESPKK